MDRISLSFRTSHRRNNRRAVVAYCSRLAPPKRANRELHHVTSASVFVGLACRAGLRGLPRPATSRSRMNGQVATWSGCASHGSSPYGESPFRQKGPTKHNPFRQKGPTYRYRWLLPFRSHGVWRVAFHQSSAFDAMDNPLRTSFPTGFTASATVSTQGNLSEFRIGPGLQEPFFQTECRASILPTN